MTGDTDNAVDHIEVDPITVCDTFQDGAHLDTLEEMPGLAGHWTGTGLLRKSPEPRHTPRNIFNRTLNIFRI